MMKLGLLSDIHADYGAALTALDLLDNQHQVDKILCAGDLIGYGGQPNEVVTLIRNRDIPVVRGNHDMPTPRISLANATYLNNLPMDWYGEIHGRSIYMCHGVPGVNMIGFSDDTLKKDGIRGLVRDVQADILIGGHTHQMLCTRVDKTWVLNPGSVYAQSDIGTSHSFGVLDLSQHTFTVYDVRGDHNMLIQFQL